MLIISGGRPEVFHCVISGRGLGLRPGRHLSVFLMLPHVKMEISNLILLMSKECSLVPYHR